MKGWVHLLVFASIALRAGASPNSIIGTGEDFDLELGHHFVKGAFGETPHKHCQRHKGPKGCVLSPKYLILVMSQVGENSALESRPNFAIPIWTKVLAQNLDQS